VIGIVMDSGSPQEIVDFVREYQIPYRQLRRGREDRAEDFGVNQGYPTTFRAGRRGQDTHQDARQPAREVREAAGRPSTKPSRPDAPPFEVDPVSVTKEQVLSALRNVQDPDLHKDIVTLGFVKEVEIRDGAVDFTVELTTPACPVKDHMKSQAEALVAALPGSPPARAKMTATSAPAAASGRQIPGIRNIVAVGAARRRRHSPRPR